ncbi:hypothetical protein Q4560_15695 [Celeribacter halophilus]|uniref:Uncharacterized protein n=1 Tax=Celeribacter halophilus TaxID=576117 RepID=A0AAW7XYB7_9RHOB|nr:hypothetical protein [Celeribacter halophilus]MDO6458965.1 hypothetical protein [Celeribacter halophilus]MDO6724715.1 hypothetical protein [Celeribacter halophilus]
MTEFWSGLAGGFLGAGSGGIVAAVVALTLDPLRRLETRRDGILQLMLEQLANVKQLGSSYWRAEYSSGSLPLRQASQEIIAILHSLQKDAQDLFEHSDKDRAYILGQIGRLRMTITGGDFGDENAVEDHERVIDLRIGADDLARDLRNRRDALKRRFY